MMSICADFGVDRGADQYPPILSPFSLLSSTLSPPDNSTHFFGILFFIFSEISDFSDFISVFWDFSNFILIFSDF